jgi:hypothetical protein
MLIGVAAFSGEKALRPDVEILSIMIAAATDRMGNYSLTMSRSFHLEMNVQRFR